MNNEIVIIYHTIGIAVGVQQQKVLAGVEQHTLCGDGGDAGLKRCAARIPIVAKAPETVGRAAVACAAQGMNHCAEAVGSLSGFRFALPDVQMVGHAKEILHGEAAGKWRRGSERGVGFSAAGRALAKEKNTQDTVRQYSFHRCACAGELR